MVVGSVIADVSGRDLAHGGQVPRVRGRVPGEHAGSGGRKNPNDSADPGWDAAWNAAMPADQAALVSAVKCGSPYHTWTDSPGGNENRPIKLDVVHAGRSASARRMLGVTRGASVRLISKP